MNRDILFTPRTEKKAHCAAADQKRVVTFRLNRLDKITQQQDSLENARSMKIVAFQKVLQVLLDASCTLADFLDYVFDPQNAAALLYDWR